jgi:hypothetical protein
MALDLHQLVHEKIEWVKSPAIPYTFVAIVQEEEVKLRLNDFPDEPLCTVIWKGGERDLEELAPSWTLPSHRGQ